MPFTNRLLSQRLLALWLSFASLLLLLAAPVSAQETRSVETNSTEPDPIIKVPDLLANPEPITPIPPPPEIDTKKLELGEALFTSTLLSRDGQRSCSSCHDLQANGADARRRDKDIDGVESAFNTNTVFNAALSFRLNWEGNVQTLEDQAAIALESSNFMGESIDDALRKLSADAKMLAMFNDAYKHAPDRSSLLDAIASFERSLLTPDSRFDRWLKGDTTAITAEERHGYELFRSYGCSSCHQGVNIGGNLYERHGIFHPLASPNPEILRVPSLRNVATTPPYFHDGSASSLDDAVRKMGLAQLNRTLTDPEAASIAAFLGTLTGRYRGTPVTGAVP